MIGASKGRPAETQHVQSRPLTGLRDITGRVGLMCGRPRRCGAAVQGWGLPVLRLCVRGTVAAAAFRHELVEFGLVLRLTQAF